MSVEKGCKQQYFCAQRRSSLLTYNQHIKYQLHHWMLIRFDSLVEVAHFWHISFLLRQVQLMAPVCLFPSLPCPLMCGRCKLWGQTFVLELHGSSLLPVILSWCVCNRESITKLFLLSECQKLHANEAKKEKRRDTGSHLALIHVMNGETGGRLRKASIHPLTHPFIHYSFKQNSVAIWGFYIILKIHTF